jgi:hypothetical protein
MGVSLAGVIVVNSIFQKNVWETPGIAPVYAVFSPVRPDGRGTFQPPVVLYDTLHRYRLCFRSLFKGLFNSAHYFHFGTLLSAEVRLSL